MKAIVLSAHAEVMLFERKLEISWIARAANSPDWVEPDTDPALERRFHAVPERDGRYIRVVCYELAGAIYVVTAFLDRGARRPP